MKKSKTCWFRTHISEVTRGNKLVQKRKNLLVPSLQGAMSENNKRPTPSVGSFTCLRYSLSSLVLAFPKYIGILDDMFMFGDRVLLHAEYK